MRVNWLQVAKPTSILKLASCSVGQRELISAVCRFRMADNFCLDTEPGCNPDRFICSCHRYVNFHPVPHIEHLEHLFPSGSGDRLNGREKWRNLEEVILDVMDAGAKPQTLCLRSTGTVNDALNMIPQGISQLIDGGCVGSCG